MARRRVDYRTLTVVGFVLVALAVLIVVLDNMQAREDAALQVRRYQEEVHRRDVALDQAQREAAGALEQSRRNGEQLDQVLAQNAQLAASITALRRQLEEHGLTPVDSGMPPVVVTPSSTSVTPPLVRPMPPSPLYRSSSAPRPRPAPSRPRPKPPPPSPTPSPSPSPTSALPVPLPSPPPICVLLICLG